MNNKFEKYIRKIKPISEQMEANKIYIHPITLELKKPKTNVYMTSPYFNPITKQIEYDVPASKIDKNDNIDIRKFMAIPYLNFDISYILHIYNIYNIDDLQLWLKKQYEENSLYTSINRIINIWIKYNYDDLKDNNNILTTIYYDIAKKFWKKYLINNDEKLKNNISNYINYWFKNTPYDDFHFNLGNDLIRHLKKIFSKN
jgi:hypothetical protein